MAVTVNICCSANDMMPTTTGGIGHKTLSPTARRPEASGMKGLTSEDYRRCAELTARMADTVQDKIEDALKIGQKYATFRRYAIEG